MQLDFLLVELPCCFDDFLPMSTNEFLMNCTFIPSALLVVKATKAGCNRPIRGLTKC